MSLDIKKCIRSAHVEMPVAHGSVGVFEELVRRSRCGEVRKIFSAVFSDAHEGNFYTNGIFAIHGES